MMSYTKQKIIPNLWFDTEAEEAANFYTSLFENAKINAVNPYPKAGQEIHQKEAGSAMTVDFELEGYQFVALNGGPQFAFNPSISFFVICRDEKEINNLWHHLIRGGTALLPLNEYDWSPKYGWLEDQYGLHWQLMIDNRRSIPKQRICPLLFFSGRNHGEAAQALEFYTSVFDNSTVEGIQKYEDEDQNQYALGGVKHAQFELCGETFMCMDSGTENDFPFNEAISFIVRCKDQQEIDKYWDKLSEGGDPTVQQCGWLKDKFGISWQIVPEELEGLLNHSRTDIAAHAMEAMMKMKKIDLHTLKKTASANSGSRK